MREWRGEKCETNDKDWDIFLLRGSEAGLLGSAESPRMWLLVCRLGWALIRRLKRKSDFPWAVSDRSAKRFSPGKSLKVALAKGIVSVGGRVGNRIQTCILIIFFFPSRNFFLGKWRQGMAQRETSRRSKRGLLDKQQHHCWNWNQKDPNFYTESGILVWLASLQLLCRLIHPLP